MYPYFLSGTSENKRIQHFNLRYDCWTEQVVVVLTWNNTCYIDDFENYAWVIKNYFYFYTVQAHQDTPILMSGIPEIYLWPQLHGTLCLPWCLHHETCVCSKIISTVACNNGTGGLGRRAIEFVESVCHNGRYLPQIAMGSLFGIKVIGKIFKIHWMNAYYVLFVFLIIPATSAVSTSRDVLKLKCFLNHMRSL